MMKAYLISYNVLSAVTWAYLWVILAQWNLGYLGEVPLWAVVELPLKLVQTAAFLEVLHAALGLVRSGVFTTLLQVLSRNIVLWGFRSSFSNADSFSMALMVGSWALVEVPRYLFYTVNLIKPKMPFALFWLRYSLFAFLYPTGITGEMLQVYACLPAIRDVSLAGWYITWVLLSFYIPGGPFMYFHMVAQRKRAFKKRQTLGQPQVPEEGILFPVNDNGDRSSTDAGKAVWSHCVAGVDRNASSAILRERNWRFRYHRHVRRHVELCVESEENCLRIARDGLTFLYKSFQFVRKGEAITMLDAMKEGRFTGSFFTGSTKGSDDSVPPPTVSVPFRGTILQGDTLVAQTQNWVQNGVIEPDTGEAIVQAARSPQWLADVRKKTFVLLGAGSAMGPLTTLLSLGARVVAVDLDRPKIWSRMIKIAHGSCGELIFPLKARPKTGDDQELCMLGGCSLTTMTPEIRNWLLEVTAGCSVVIGNYCYLDGAKHVQVSLACDAIIRDLCQKQTEGRRVAVAFLASPTDVFMIPDAARQAQSRNYKDAPWWQHLISKLTKHLHRNALPRVKASHGEGKASLNDGISVAQGPNYALSKRMQHWRAMVARYDHACAVSANIAPSTRTLSVMHNKMFALAFNGMGFFRPLEVEDEETSRAVMSILLLHDVCSPDSVAPPSFSLSHPLELFALRAFHGGIWRCGFKMDTIGTIAALAYLSKVAVPWVVLSSAVLVGYIYSDLPLPHEW